MANLGVNKIIAQAQAAAKAATIDANQRQQQQFPQMVQPIQNYYPTPVTPTPVVTQAPAPVVPVPAVPAQSVVQAQAPMQPQQNPFVEWLLNWAQNPGQPVVGTPNPPEPAQAVMIPALPSPQTFAPQQQQQPQQPQQPQSVVQQIPVLQQQPPAMNPAPPPADYTQQATAIQQWLGSGGQNPGLPVGTQPTQQLPIQILDLPKIDNPVPGWSVPELQAQAAAGKASGTPIPEGGYTNSGRDGRQERADNGQQQQPQQPADTSSTTPAGPAGEQFLMRPRGLSGPSGEPEKAIQLTDYEGLADNARARRLSWDEYSKLTEDARRAADLNKLLVRSREDDLTRDKPMPEAREAQYAADVAEVFGPGGTKSTTVAPRLVGLLADLDIDAAGKDLDDYLSLREGISVDEIDKGALQMDLANRVQFKAETAFQEEPNKYWNLNSAVRGLDPKTAKNAPAGFGGRKEPTEGWNDEKLYSNLWEGVQNNDPAWTVEKTKKLLDAADFSQEDWTRLTEAMYLRAQNERLYAPTTSETMSTDGKKRRSPDEIMQFLSDVARAK